MHVPILGDVCLKKVGNICSLPCRVEVAKP